MKKNLQRFGASVLAAAMVAQSVALRCCAVTTPWKKTLKLFRKPMPR